MISTKAFIFEFTLVMTVLLGAVSSYESSQRVRLTEGKPAEISFQFGFEFRVDIQIRIGNRRPFYGSNRIHEAGLSESQKERFIVKVEDNESYDMIHVRLIISSVSREDEGTFICHMLRDGEVLHEHTRKIGVSVDFPPGRASCRQENHHIDHSNKDWALMKCSAPVGNDQGIIECYQGGERMPPRERSVQNETTLTQIIWMRNSIPIYCCASAFDKPKGMCQCDDFLWDPVMQNRIRGDVDPCPESENLLPSAESQSNTIVPDAQTPTSNSFDNRIIEDCHCSFSGMKLVVAIVLTIQVITVITLISFIQKVKIIIAHSKITNKDKEEGVPTESPKRLNDSSLLRKRKGFAEWERNTYPLLNK